MTIKFSFVSPKGGRELFSADGTNKRLLKKDTYEQSSTKNDFENDIATKVKKLENTYTKESLTNLSTGLTKIFITNSSTDAQKSAAVEGFNEASSKVSITSWDQIKEGSQIRNDVYTYYEYVQFKRARFDCEKVEYSQKTGRIIRMEFKFTGKFE